ncbi:MAG: Uma2 family endonuclease [Chloroflexota bacterium]|nr:Uma2 family endonuclease [Chloroflexota bacterium]
MAITGRRLTLEEFLALPGEKPALEYVDGEVTRKVSPKYRHIRVQYRLADLVNNFAVPRRLARAEPELRVNFGGRSVVPDVSIFTWDRIPEDEDGEVQDDVFSAPDIAVDILSPGQRVRDQVDHCRWYVANGVRLSVFVNTQDRYIRTFRPDGEAEPLGGADRVNLSDVIPGFSFAVDELFAALRAR